MNYLEMYCSVSVFEDFPVIFVLGIVCLDMCFVVTWWECVFCMCFINVDYILLDDSVVEFSYILNDFMSRYPFSYWEEVLKFSTRIVRFSFSFFSVSFCFTYFAAVIWCLCIYDFYVLLGWSSHLYIGPFLCVW